MENQESPSVGSGWDRITIILSVRDIVQARAFYQRAFEAESDPEEGDILYPGGGRECAIRLVAGNGAEESISVETEGNQETPCCEFVVDDPATWSERAVAIGAHIVSRQTNPKGELIYVQVADPFGYRWSLAVSSDGET